MLKLSVSSFDELALLNPALSVLVNALMSFDGVFP